MPTVLTILSRLIAVVMAQAISLSLGQHGGRQNQDGDRRQRPSGAQEASRAHVHRVLVAVQQLRQLCCLVPAARLSRSPLESGAVLVSQDGRLCCISRKEFTIWSQLGAVQHGKTAVRVIQNAETRRVYLIRRQI